MGHSDTISEREMMLGQNSLVSSIGKSILDFKTDTEIIRSMRLIHRSDGYSVSSMNDILLEEPPN